MSPSVTVMVRALVPVAASTVGVVVMSRHTLLCVVTKWPALTRAWTTPLSMIPKSRSFPLGKSIQAKLGLRG